VTATPDLYPWQLPADLPPRPTTPPPTTQTDTSNHDDAGPITGLLPAADTAPPRPDGLPPNRPVARSEDPVTTGRTISAPLWTPSATSRRQRRTVSRQARNVEVDARKTLMAERQAKIEATRTETELSAYLPSGGATGPAALRSWRRLRLQPHRATSEILASAYPFLAEAGLGSHGVLVGHDSWSGAGFVYDPWVLYQTGVLTNPNALLAGVIGRGKSTLAKSLATRSIAFGRRVYIPGDPKGEWTPVARAVGGQAIELGGHLPTRLNPLDEGPRTPGTNDEQWQTETAKRRRALLGSLTETALGRPLAPVEHTALDAALTATTHTTTTPTLPVVVDRLLQPDNSTSGSSVAQLRDDGRQAGHALARLVHGDLAGLFDGPSTTRFDPTLPMVSLDLSRIAGSDTLIALVMTCASAWMEAALADPNGGQRWVIYDEAWRLLRQATLLTRMQSQWKLSRALGIANLMIIHRLSDLDAIGDANSQTRNLAQGLLADCSTKIIYTQERGEATRTGTALGLSTTETDQLPDLEQGEGLWRIGQRSFVIRHQCTPNELNLFDTNARMH
jgi:hypothetical protein